MEKMNDLRDLLKHEIADLYSAEEQIIEALPAMIEKAKNSSLKTALKDHLKVTKKQRDRLTQVQNLLSSQEEKENKGLLSRLFKRNQVCKGMKGILDEGQKVMSEDMSPEVMDAAIIACAQKVEHYEICGYGTARAYAQELNLGHVADLLEETLNEEYAADDQLTDLAVTRLNKQAESRSASRKTSTGSASAAGTGSRSTARERMHQEAEELELVSRSNRNSGGSTSRTAANKGTGTARTAAANTGNRSTASGRSSAASKSAANRSQTTGRRGASGQNSRTGSRS